MSIMHRSFAASAIILIAILVRKLAMNRLPKRTFVALWLLAAARMLIPWELPFRFSASALVNRAAEPAIRAAIPAIPAAALPAYAPVAARAVEIPIWRIVWIVGIIACALAFTLPHLRWRRVYARSLPAADADISAWLQKQKLLRRVRVRISDEIPSPLTCGLLRPMILLPANLRGSDAQNLEYVLAHELTHIRHWDALWKLVLAAALCVHWFNPLAWAMYLLANRDIELACDEAVLRRFGEGTRRDYARTLLDLAARQSGLPSPLFSGSSRQTIEERIRAIMKMKKLTKIAALAAVALVAFSALAFATSAKPEDMPERTEDPRAEIKEMMFDGYEDMSVREYSAWLDSLGIDLGPLLRHKENVWYSIAYDDFLYYALQPMNDANFRAQGRWSQDGTFGGENLDTGEEFTMNYRVTCQVLDQDRLTVGRLRDSLKMVWEGINLLDPLNGTQTELQERVAKLESEWSDGSTIAFQIEVELQGEDSPYTDPNAAALLEKYAALGLEYDTFLGELTMSYQGRDVQGIYDPEVGEVIANSTGPKGLGGDSILEVIYKDGVPAELQFVDK